MKIKEKKFTIVLPFYNEQDIAKNVIRSLVREARRNNLAMKFVLVDNGSTDNTGKIIKDLVAKFSELKSITIRKNQGYGYGIRRGLAIAKGDYIGYMWGDGQILPKDLFRVAKILLKNLKLDICKATRIKRNDGTIRNIVSLFYNFLFSLIFSLKIRDINGTPKIFKRSSYNQLHLTSNDWFLDAELIIKAHKLNLKKEEIPIIFHTRKQGSSNVKFMTIFEFLKNLLIFRFKEFNL